MVTSEVRSRESNGTGIGVGTPFLSMMMWLVLEIYQPGMDVGPEHLLSLSDFTFED